MRILFLDFDGVLNTTRYRREHPIPKGISFFERAVYRIDPIAVARVNKILDATGAKVVVSSTWRMGLRTEQLSKLLVAGGLVEGKVIGKTPSLPGDHRGSEILRWLDGNPDWQRYVVLDDDAFDMDGVRDHFLHVNPIHGLTDEDARKAIEMFEAP